MLAFAFGLVPNSVATPSMSTENLAKASNISRVPSNTNTRNRNVRSGIPIAHREFPTRGGIINEIIMFLYFVAICLVVHWHIYFLCSKFFLLIIFLMFSHISRKIETNRRIHLFFGNHVASNFRSVSALDANAVQRAKARAQYSNYSRLKVQPGAASVRKYSSIHTHNKKLFLIKLQNNSLEEIKISYCLMRSFIYFIFARHDKILQKEYTHNKVYHKYLISPL